MAGRTRVALLVESLDDMGGAVRVATQVANALCSRYDVMFIELRGDSGGADGAKGRAFPLDPVVEVVALGVDAARIVDKARAITRPLCRLIRQRGVDVVLTVAAEEASAAWLACKLAGVPLVFCDHESIMSQIDLKKTVLVKKTLAKRCAKTVVLTEASRRAYVERLGVPGRKLTRIPNWIPDELAGADARYDVDAPRVIWAGRLDVEKGVDHLFEVARRVLPPRPGWTIDVYGRAVTGTSDFDLAGAARGAGIDGQFRLMGQVDDLYERYSRYSIGILTSYREGLPLFLLEGKACGLPLVSFDVVTGPSEIIDDGVNGCLVEPFDIEAYARALGRLMDDRGLRQRMHDASQEGVDAWSKPAIVRQWAALIDSLA